MIATLVLPQSLADEILVAARNSLETGGVMLVSVVETDGQVRLLGRSMLWVPDDCYERREWNGLTIKSDGYIHALSHAEEVGSACIWVHTHPGERSSPIPSRHDTLVDSQICDLFRLRTGSEYYGALIFSPNGPEFSFSGYIQHADRKPIPIEKIWQVGDDWRLIRGFASPSVQLSSVFERNVLAFGPAIQAALGELRVGIVGCGGTGSIVAEQLARLGVRSLTLVDSDLLSESNITRVYGSTFAVVGRPKVLVLSQHLREISPSIICVGIESMVTVEQTARQLVGCDVIFGCTDDNAGRLILSRLSSYMLTPVIDCGVLISSGMGGLLSGIDARITVLSPGTACLVCRGRIDLARAAAEMLTPDERVKREDEGYAPALGGTEPAVVAFTTMVGSFAVSELLERLIGYGPSPRPSEIVLRIHEREISVNVANPRPGHYCDPEKGKLGSGVTKPFLDQTWQA